MRWDRAEVRRADTAPLTARSMRRSAPSAEVAGRCGIAPVRRGHDAAPAPARRSGAPAATSRLPIRSAERLRALEREIDEVLAGAGGRTPAS